MIALSIYLYDWTAVSLRDFPIERRQSAIISRLPFAGHPTLGSCDVWLATGATPKGREVVQECGIGLVRIRRRLGLVSFAAPKMRRSGAVVREVLEHVRAHVKPGVTTLDLENLVTELGHEVIGTAATREQAVKLAYAKKPGLILADINLGEGGSGIDAVSEILDSFDIPVIFVTAYPEKLLTGERPEPTYLIAKPFLPETVQATIGQALFFHAAHRKAA